MVAIIALVFTIIFFPFSSPVSALRSNYYDKTCPHLEQIVNSTVEKAMKNDNKVAARLLRMHFHDCFIRGCDASVLLEKKGNHKAEKDGPPNISLRAFYVIDHAKEKVEALCPGVVSCADILALAARDAVFLSGGPTWKVPKGRKDGIISKADDTILPPYPLPSPKSNISELRRNFSERGLSLKDLVALSGGHTLGFSHCFSFQDRIHNFNDTLDIDPSLNPSFANSLRSECPMHNKNRSAGSVLDFTPFKFDNMYYKLLLQGKSILTSDQALLTDKRTRALVVKYATCQEEFEKAFVKSMIRMSKIRGHGRQEIRLNCRVVR
ncbi:hypothetical protein SLEP1_g4185 [Rubroshorea leprosula]|uniref:Peroxidase n=1 Tax=Rubroshorea leprosula TaxID=152421 RepID=A0AAV5HYJ5_9ROSI|nr:hypothetical protein SLEP1_g4185 [Rubroshorea leprosula]